MDAFEGVINHAPTKMKLKQIKNFLHDDSPALLEDLVQRARVVTRQRFGRAIQMYAPLYISNECVDTCTYCGFSRPNQIKRVTLTVDQVQQEANFLIAQGFQHLLLVAGEHPQSVSPHYITEIARCLRPQLASLSIEVAPFETQDYRTLSAAGVDGIVIYQETYNRKRYAEVHLGGPKMNYDKRMEAPERAAQGGMRRIGVGVLLGLADWRQDVLALIEHVRQLQKKYWQVEFQISLPRLRPCHGGIDRPVFVSDSDFVKVFCLLRLALPELGLVLSTREEPALRDVLTSIAITQMSAGSKTQPGAYQVAMEAEEQFSVSDRRSPAQVAAALRKQNLEPVWKDWENVLFG
jgi:2-iminoacetate synthase